MKKNFYNNPLKLIWMARSNLLPPYLINIWVLLILFMYMGTFLFDFIDFSNFTIDHYFSASTTGLTFTLALFTAQKNVFKPEELKILAEHRDEKDKFKGKALIELLGPFVFTGLVFLLTGTLSIIVPFINIEVPSFIEKILIQGYIDILVLGLFSLFNLVVTMLNDVYHSVNRMN